MRFDGGANSGDGQTCISFLSKIWVFQVCSNDLDLLAIHDTRYEANLKFQWIARGCSLPVCSVSRFLRTQSADVRQETRTAERADVKYENTFHELVIST